MRLSFVGLVFLLPVFAIVAPLFIHQRGFPTQLVIPWRIATVLTIVFLVAFSVIRKNIKTYNIPMMLAISPAIIGVFLVNGGIEAYYNVQYLLPYRLTISELLFFLFVYYSTITFLISIISLCKDINEYYETGQIKGWLLPLCDLGNMLNRIFNP